MSVEALNCPNCGAAVESDRSICEFCKTRLKTVGCAKCLGLMFVGTKFCGHCGAIATPVDVGIFENASECPRCRSRLVVLEVDDISFRGCENCDGLWINGQMFETICADLERQSAVLTFLDARTHRGPSMTKINYVPCPDCGHLMNRNNFAKASGVIVDICKQHGVWFDADELPAIVDFIRKGGMDLKRQREQNEIDLERSRLREERWKADISPRSSRLGRILEDELTSDRRSFVRRLFDI
jgi:Zn-finger nucleic acid-binding protein